jgi:cell division protein FtsL
MLLKNPLIKLIVWMLAWRQLSVALLVALLMASAVGVALSSHQTRQMYTRLQVIGLDSDALDSEYEKLLLEQSAWADFARVDQVARAELSMQPPVAENMVIVKR